MAKKRQIKLNRKPKVEEKEVTLEEALEEMEEKTEETPVVEEDTLGTTVVENKISDIEQVMWSRSQLKGEIVWNWERTVMQRPRWRIKFEAQVAAVPMFKLPEEIRRYLESHGLPTTVWQWDKERLEKRNVDKVMVEKLKAFLSGNY